MKTHMTKEHIFSNPTITQFDKSDIQPLSDIGLCQFIPYVLIEVIGHWNNRLQYPLRDNDLTNIKARILAVLSFYSGATINELSSYTVIEQSTISRALDSLESQGFINRIADKNDGRVRRIFISGDGQKAFTQSWPAIDNNTNILMKNISQKEKQSFLKTLNKMQQNMNPTQQ